MLSYQNNMKFSNNPCSHQLLVGLVDSATKNIHRYNNRLPAHFSVTSHLDFHVWPCTRYMLTEASKIHLHVKATLLWQLSKAWPNMGNRPKVLNLLGSNTKSYSRCRLWNRCSVIFPLLYYKQVIAKLPQNIDYLHLQIVNKLQLGSSFHRRIRLLFADLCKACWLQLATISVTVLLWSTRLHRVSTNPARQFSGRFPVAF